MNEQQTTVNALLQENNIAYGVRYVGETMRDNKWQCDAWRVSFTAVRFPQKLPGTVSIETDYYTGLGHRKPVKGSNQMRESKFPKNTVGYHNWVKQYVRPTAPCAADVLYGLILDSSAIDTSFEYWCSDYGYDADSISALNTYQACCKIAKELRQVFTNAQVETLRGLLEDY